VEVYPLARLGSSGWRVARYPPATQRREVYQPPEKHQLVARRYRLLSVRMSWPEFQLLASMCSSGRSSPALEGVLELQPS